MKTNNPLQNSLGFLHQAHKVYYAALVLKAALTPSPAVLVRQAVPAVAARAAVLAQTAKLARASSVAVAASANTVGYAFGELYLNSPAYPIGTAIPAISAKPASAAVTAVLAVVGIPAVAAVSSPEVKAMPGWEDAIKITKSATVINIIAEFPHNTGVGIVGSNLLSIGEITPSTLQANAWIDAPASPGSHPYPLDANIPTLEQYLYKYAQQCNHTITNIIRDVNGVSIPCKRLEINLYPLPTFNPLSASAQLGLVQYAPVAGS
jgi:hypothetical protein